MTRNDLADVSSQTVVEARPTVYFLGSHDLVYEIWEEAGMLIVVLFVVFCFDVQNVLFCNGTFLLLCGV